MRVVCSFLAVLVSFVFAPDWPWVMWALLISVGEWTALEVHLSGLMAILLGLSGLSGVAAYWVYRVIRLMAGRMSDVICS